MIADCSKCCEVTKIYEGSLLIYIGATADHLLVKIEKILTKNSTKFQRQKNYFIVFADSFETFIYQISDMEIFSTIEMKDVTILPVSKDISIDFGSIIHSKSLNHWMTYYKNMDVIEAIENKRINTLFQPIVRVKDLSIYGHEALCRAMDVEGKPIPNDRLFKSSKQLELLFNLDRQCRIAGVKNASEYMTILGKLFINFIPTVIYDPNVCLRTTHEIVQKSNFIAEDIVFEVVESEHIEDYEHLSNILEHYRSKGYKTALDDVGAGYSTLVNYNKLRTDFVKIDQEIIRNIHTSPSKQAYLKQVLDLRTKSGFKIIAEGIETDSEFEYVKSMDIDLVQGYFFGKPQEKPVKSLN